jgi:hypothetical protein
VDVEFTVSEFEVKDFEVWGVIEDEQAFFTQASPYLFPKKLKTQVWHHSVNSFRQLGVRHPTQMTGEEGFRPFLAFARVGRKRNLRTTKGKGDTNSSFSLSHSVKSDQLFDCRPPVKTKLRFMTQSLKR